MLALRLPPKIDKRLARLSKKTGRTKSFYAREAIVDHLDDLEDLYLAQSRVADIDAGRTQTIPLDDFLRERGLLE